MKYLVSFSLLFLFSCSNSQDENLFDHEYDSMCDAFLDISRYAAHLHINGRNRDYDEVRNKAAQRLAQDYEYDGTTSSKNCEDIEAIVSHSKSTQKEVYSDFLLEFMQELDPHSLYFSEDATPKVQDDRKNMSFGMGVEFKYTHRAIKKAMPVNMSIDYVYPDTPATNILQRGDQIEEINDQAIDGLKLSEINKLIPDDAKSINIKIKRLDDSIEIPLKNFQKSHFYVAPVAKSDRIMRVRVPKFTGGLSKSLSKELPDLENSTDGLILDLRGNPGGLVDEALHLIDLFVPGKDEVFYTEGEYNEKGSDLYSHQAYKTSDDQIYTKPMVVLVDSDTASASEIVSSVLKINHRATILGNRTFGKASVQIDRLISTKNGFGGMLITTIALIYYPNGPTHQIHGVSPNYELLDNIFGLAITELANQDLKFIVHESDYENPIQPKSGSSYLRHASTMDVNAGLQSAEDFPDELDACTDIPYDECLEEYAVRILEQGTS